MTSEESNAGDDRVSEEDRLDPTIMFGAASGRVPTAAEVVAQTILQMIADGKRPAAQKQMERDKPLLDKHQPGEGVGVDVAAIVELAREIELIPDPFAIPMAQLLRGVYAPEAKKDLVMAVRNDRAHAALLRDQLPQTAPALGRVFAGLIGDALSIREKTGPTLQVEGGSSRTVLVLLLVAIVAAAGALVFVLMRR